MLPRLAVPSAATPRGKGDQRVGADVERRPKPFARRLDVRRARAPLRGRRPRRARRSPALELALDRFEDAAIWPSSVTSHGRSNRSSRPAAISRDVLFEPFALVGHGETRAGGGGTPARSPAAIERLLATRRWTGLTGEGMRSCGDMFRTAAGVSASASGRTPASGVRFRRGAVPDSPRKPPPAGAPAGTPRPWLFGTCPGQPAPPPPGGLIGRAGPGPDPTGARPRPLVAARADCALEIGAARRSTAGWAEVRGLADFLVPVQPGQRRPYQRAMHGAVFDGLRGVCIRHAGPARPCLVSTLLRVGAGPSAVSRAAIDRTGGIEARPAAAAAHARAGGVPKLVAHRRRRSRRALPCRPRGVFLSGGAARRRP